MGIGHCKKSKWAQALQGPGALGAEVSLGIGFFLTGAVEGVGMQRLQVTSGSPGGVKLRWTRALEGQETLVGPLGL